MDSIIFPQLRPVRGEVVASWIDELLRILQLDDKSDAFPAQLSGGMRRRLGVAVALAGKPEVNEPQYFLTFP